MKKPSLSPPQDLVAHELKRLAKEARLYTRSSQPHLGLLRVASALESLLKSLDHDQLSQECSLTSREFEILGYVSQGYTNKEISIALELSEKTIEFHISSLLKKTESTTRTEAVSHSYHFGWLKLP